MKVKVKVKVKVKLTWCIQDKFINNFCCLHHLYLSYSFQESTSLIFLVVIQRIAMIKNSPTIYTSILSWHIILCQSLSTCSIFSMHRLFLFQCTGSFISMHLLFLFQCTGSFISMHRVFLFQCTCSFFFNAPALFFQCTGSLFCNAPDVCF